MIKKITTVIILSSIAILIIYDIFAALKGGESATISAQVWHFSKEYPVVSFAAGFLSAHLFWGKSND